MTEIEILMTVVSGIGSENVTEDVSYETFQTSVGRYRSTCVTLLPVQIKWMS